MKVVTAALAALLVYLAMAFALARKLGLKPPEFLVLFGGLAVIGIAAVGILLWYKFKVQKAGAALSAFKPEPGGGDEADQVVREAAARLAESKAANGAGLNQLPLVFLIGGDGAVKTHTVLHSGLEPELLAGQVYQDNNVVPTRVLNLWYARQAILAEPSAKLLGDSARWVRLVRRLRPAALKTVVSQGEQAPRAAVLCLSLDLFTQPGTNDALAAAARQWRERLGEISQTLGVNFPVYVLFTKADRVPSFAEYVRNLSNEEAAQVFGATLPLRPTRSGGIYAEQETQRLSQAFDELFYSLCDCRLDVLPREHDGAKVPAAYEFPREFRKLRGAVVQFLVDVCRPSQLSTSPFLRGFYFSGVRPVVVNESAPLVAAPTSRGGFEAASNATRIFSVGGFAAEPAIALQSQAVASTRKVPQWLFLGHLFHHVILQDRAALSASGASVKTSALRRTLLASAAGLSLLLAICFLISYSKNRALLSEAQSAAARISASEGTAGTVPSAEAMQNLNTLLDSLQQLTTYRQEGAPFSLRWGLYAGDDALASVRRLYYDKFDQMFFGETRAGMQSYLKGRPGQAGPNDEFNPTYNLLKAYLITTSHYDKRSAAFLTPVLVDRWAAAHPAGAGLRSAWQRHANFYSNDPLNENPLPLAEDLPSVANARRHLDSFQGFLPIYNTLLTEVARKTTPVNFNARFPGSAETVINNRDVAGPFTKDGHAAMLDQIKNVDRRNPSDEWVFKPSNVAIVQGTLKDQLQKQYQSDYIKAWLTYLRNTQLVPYKTLGDAAEKLGKIVGSQTPLLAMFSLASQHTAIDDQVVKDAFRSVQHVVPPANTSLFSADSNKNYMDSLTALQASLRDAADPQVSTPADQKAAATRVKASDARTVVVSMARNFGVDTVGAAAITERLLNQPITMAEALVRDLGPAELNKKGGAFCGEANKLFSKYPFNPRGTTEATLDEVAAMFKPGEGTLWKFYEESLKNALEKQGSQYVPKAGASPALNGPFVNYFNHMAGFSQAIYPAGAATPKLSYALKAGLPHEQIQSFQLTLDGKTANFTTAAPQTLTWPAGSNAAQLKGKISGNDTVLFQAPASLWSTWRFFGDAEDFRSAGSTDTVTWRMKTGRENRVLYTYQFVLDMNGQPPVFRPGYLSGMRCVLPAAK